MKAIPMIQAALLFCFIPTAVGAGNVRGASHLARNLQDFMLMDPPVNALAADPEHLYPLGRCQGDCDDDTQCMYGLRCYQRDANTTVPGCSGGEEDATPSDYCIRLEDYPAEGAVSVSTMNPSKSPSSFPSATPSDVPSFVPSSLPSSLPTRRRGELAVVYPMQLCEGDCDSNEDCDKGLICWQRESGEDPVPYCEGIAGTSRTDFCVPAAAVSEAQSVAPSPEPSVSSEPSFSPTESKTPSVSPSASMVPSDTPTVSVEPSTSASPTIMLIELHDFGALPPSDKSLMTLCEGDCDDDYDCVAGLKCLHRNAGDDVTGCKGDFSSASNFCVKSDTLAPLVDYGDTPPEAFKPFRFCEGDCDFDSDCGEGLVCKQRVAGEVVEGCEGDFSSHSDYCVWQ